MTTRRPSEATLARYAEVQAGRLAEVRVGGRNFIRSGDYCWVRGPRAGARGFPARFTYAEEMKGRLVACVEELEHGRRVSTRFVDLERIQRKQKDPYA